MYKSGDIINGEYAVSRVFTNGGMGLVYKVRHLAWKMDLALKCPRKELFQTNEQKRSFTKECETWIDLGVHPNIVACFYIRQIDAIPSVVMEYLDSGSLADYIDSGRLYNDTPLNVLVRILDIGIQTARGLGYAHGKGYVHQDVKPANTLMNSSGVVKISDFGLSRAKGAFGSAHFAPDKRSIIVSSGGCTPAYASPEQMLGRPLSRRTDIWSWAVMMLEMIHGKIFWKIGPLASRALKELWPWQVFSKHVQKSSELLRILKECLNENEAMRPHDFDVIAARLVRIYEQMVNKKYPRAVPPTIFLSEATLCNRIASYAELEKAGGSYFNKVFDIYTELKKVSPWSIWGDLNYANYSRIGGLQELFRTIDNVLQYAVDETEKSLIVDMLLSAGRTSLFDSLYRKLKLSDCPRLFEKVWRTHEYVRSRLVKVFSAAPKLAGKDYYKSDYAGGHMCCKFSGEDCIIAHGVSEHKQCYVEVITSRVAKHCLQGWLEIQIRANLSGRVYCCNDNMPESARIRFLTADDFGRKISLWVYYNGKFFQKVLRIEDGKLIPYGIDYRHNEGWGIPQVIVEGGDACRMLIISGTHCRVWCSENPTAGDGRNVCDFFLSDYGLIPPEDVLPNFRLERAFGYKIDCATAYRLMNELCEIYAKQEPKCIIRLPDNSSIDIERTNRGLIYIERAKQALVDNNERLLVLELSKSVSIGVMPEDSLLEKRHNIVKHHSPCRLTTVWQQVYDDKYWDGEALRMFSIDGTTPDVATYGVHIRLDIGDGNPNIITIVRCKKFANGDILGLRYVNEAKGEMIIELCRYATAHNLYNIKWKFKFPKPQHVTVVMKEFRITDRVCSFVVDNDVYVIDLGSGTLLNRLSSLKYIRYSKINFDSISPLRFCVVDGHKFLAFDRDFSPHDDLCNWASGVLGGNTIFDVSNDGTKILFDVGWGMQMCDIIRRKIEVVMRYDSYPCYCRAIFSPCGRAIAISIGTSLRIFDFRSKKTVFDYAVHDEEPIREMCFDKTGRFFYVLHGHNKIEAFQLYWDIEANDNAV